MTRDYIDTARAHADPTSGFQSIADAGLDPAEECMRHEEEEEGDVARDVMAERQAIFARLRVHIHGGTLDPGEWSRRWFALARHVAADMVAGVDHAEWERDCAWMSARAAQAVVDLHARAWKHGRNIWQEQGLEHRTPQLATVLPRGASERWRATLRRILEDTAANGIKADAVAKRFSAMTQFLEPRLLCMASCEQIAALFGQKGRAATSARVRAVCNKRIERAGGTAHGAFQKSATAVEKMKIAQLGNTNRRAKPAKKMRATRLCQGSRGQARKNKAQ
jgi:hypothetical protein